jgi:pseudaminic acid synthase
MEGRVKLGKLDTAEQVVIVAEIGANHGGHLECALALVNIAKQAGADMVKFQAYLPEELATDDDDPIPEGPWAGKKLIDLYREACTPLAWLPSLFSEARKLGLEPFASVFGMESLAAVGALDPVAYKISSFEINYHPLLEAVGSKGKPVIVSTGMAQRGDISELYQVLAPLTDEVMLLHCVSGYPTPLEEANLYRIWRGPQERNLIPEMGLSYHSRSPLVPAIAAAVGARLIEVHLCIDHNIPTPDEHFSMDREEFTAMVQAVREAEAAMKPSERKSEDPQRALRRRLVDGRWLRRVRP